MQEASQIEIPRYALLRFGVRQLQLKMSFFYQPVYWVLICVRLQNSNYQDLFLTMNSSILSCLFLAYLSLSLHCELHQLVQHTLTDLQYYTQLISLQNTLIDTLAKTQIQIDSFAQLVKTQSSIQNIQPALLQSLIEQQRNTMAKVDEYIKSPLQPKPCNVSAETIQSKDALLNKSLQVKSSVKSLKSELLACANCTISSSLNRLILQQGDLLKVIKTFCLSNCTSTPQPLAPAQPSGLVDLTTSKYKNNLNAKNWVYGNVTKQDYKYQVFWDSIKHNHTNCPIETPYVNPITLTCFQCPNGLNFSLGEKICVTCPATFTWNALLLKCSPISQSCQSWQTYNFTLQKCVDHCQAGHTYYQQNNTCQCFAEKPFFNTVTRVCEEPPCPYGQKWNPNLKKCSLANGNCQPWQTYNFNTETCVDKCLQSQTYYPSNDTCSCPSTDPVFNLTTRSCQEPVCLNGKIWDRTQDLCRCQDGFATNASDICVTRCTTAEYFNKTTNTCMLIPPKCGANMFVNASNTCQCLTGYIFEPASNDCRLNCPVGTNYDSAAQKCITITCPAGQHFNSTINTCVITLPTCGANMFVNASNICQCLSGYTLDTDGQSCRIICSAGHQYNLSTKQCELTECPIGFSLDKIAQKCVITPPTCGVNMFVNASNSCQCLSGYILEEGGHSCRPNCGSGEVYSPTTSKCISTTCPAGQHFDSTTISCQANPVCGANMILNGLSCQCLAGYVQEKGGLSCRLNCSEGYSYNEISGKCELSSCPPGQYLNSTTKKCQLVPPKCGANMFVNASNSCQCLFGYILEPDGLSCKKNCPEGTEYKVSTNSCEQIVCGAGYFFNSTTKHCQHILICPQGSFLNTSSNLCVSCPPNYTFNTNTQLCDPAFVPCPKGQYFNPEDKKCLPLYITSPKAANLISTNMTAYQQDYNSQKKLNAKLSDCAMPNPFYDKTAGQCLTCPTDYPYFNLDLNKCQNCASNEIYNSVKYACVVEKQVEIDPTIGRFMANVI